jgi:predicted amidohydrolase YtcJ
MVKSQKKLGRRQFLGNSAKLAVTASTLTVINKNSKADTTPQISVMEALAPDKIYFNGRIVTVDDDFTIAEAVAIKKDRFLAVGSNKQILKTAGANTEKIDLAGKTVIPGLIDAHGHSDRAAISELSEPIPDVHTVGELLDSIAEKVKNKTSGEWIVYPRLFATRLREMRWPTKAGLDKAAPDNPVFLDGAFGGMVNSCALRVCNITAETSHKGVLKENGEPTGLLHYSAFELLKDRPTHELTYEQKLDAVVNMNNRYNSVGITGMSISTAGPATLKMYQDLHKQGRLTARMLLTMNLANLGLSAADPVEKIRDRVAGLGLATGSGNEWVRTGDLKLFLDGGILTGTAYLRQPWAKVHPERVKQVYGVTDPAYRGVLRVIKQQLTNVMTIANELGWRFTAHCTGGGGVDMMLDCYEQVNKVKSIKTRRFAITHGNFFTAEAIERMKTLGIYSDSQPAWFYKDADAMEYLLGKEWLKTFHPYKSLFDAGIVVNGGSDHMVKFDSYTSTNPYNPFLSMWSAITRKTERASVINGEQAISRQQALRMYTINNAYPSFEEDIKGSIEAGKLADMVVLSEDIMTCPADNIKDIKAEMTVVGGKEAAKVS